MFPYAHARRRGATALLCIFLASVLHSWSHQVAGETSAARSEVVRASSDVVGHPGGACLACQGHAYSLVDPAGNGTTPTEVDTQVMVALAGPSTSLVTGAPARAPPAHLR